MPISKGGIEYSNVWFAWAYFFASFNTHQVCRVVQRTQVEALADSSFNIVVDNDGFGELCAAVEYAVTIALISSTEAITPWSLSVRASRTSFTATEWSGIGFQQHSCLCPELCGSERNLRCRFSHTDLLSERARSPYQSADISERSFRSSLQEFSYQIPP